MKLSFNSPAVLTFALIAVIVHVLTDTIMPGLTRDFFTSRGVFDFNNVTDYFRLFSHAIGHGDWNHLIGNFSLILLIGPILEEKHGTQNLSIMMFLTAIITGILNNIFFNTGLLGASGIVFMMILLGSLVNFRKGTIPLTFILIIILYLGREIFSIFKEDQISQAAHIFGGICGMIFGFIFTGKKSPVTVTK